MPKTPIALVTHPSKDKHGEHKRPWIFDVTDEGQMLARLNAGTAISAEMSPLLLRVAIARNYTRVIPYLLEHYQFSHIMLYEALQTAVLFGHDEIFWQLWPQISVANKAYYGLLQPRVGYEVIPVYGAQDLDPMTALEIRCKQAIKKNNIHLLKQLLDSDAAKTGQLIKIRFSELIREAMGSKRAHMITYLISVADRLGVVLAPEHIVKLGLSDNNLSFESKVLIDALAVTMPGSVKAALQSIDQCPGLLDASPLLRHLWQQVVEDKYRQAFNGAIGIKRKQPDIATLMAAGVKPSADVSDAMYHHWVRGNNTRGVSSSFDLSLFVAENIMPSPMLLERMAKEGIIENFIEHCIDQHYPRVVGHVLSHRSDLASFAAETCLTSRGGKSRQQAAMCEAIINHSGQYRQVVIDSLYEKSLRSATSEVIKYLREKQCIPSSGVQGYISKAFSNGLFSPLPLTKTLVEQKPGLSQQEIDWAFTAAVDVLDYRGDSASLELLCKNNCHPSPALFDSTLDKFVARGRTNVIEYLLKQTQSLSKTFVDKYFGGDDVSTDCWKKSSGSIIKKIRVAESTVNAAFYAAFISRNNVAVKRLRELGCEPSPAVIDQAFERLAESDDYFAFENLLGLGFRHSGSRTKNERFPMGYECYIKWVFKHSRAAAKQALEQKNRLSQQAVDSAFETALDSKRYGLIGLMYEKEYSPSKTIFNRAFREAVDECNRSLLTILLKHDSRLDEWSIRKYFGSYLSREASFMKVSDKLIKTLRSSQKSVDDAFFAALRAGNWDVMGHVSKLGCTPSQDIVDQGFWCYTQQGRYNDIIKLLNMGFAPSAQALETTVRENSIQNLLELCMIWPHLKPLGLLLAIRPKLAMMAIKILYPADFWSSLLGTKEKQKQIYAVIIRQAGVYRQQVIDYTFQRACRTEHYDLLKLLFQYEHKPSAMVVDRAFEDLCEGGAGPIERILACCKPTDQAVVDKVFGALVADMGCHVREVMEKYGLKPSIDYALFRVATRGDFECAKYLLDKAPAISADKVRRCFDIATKASNDEGLAFILELMVKRCPKELEVAIFQFLESRRGADQPSFNEAGRLIPKKLTIRQSVVDLLLKSMIRVSHTGFRTLRQDNGGWITPSASAVNALALELAQENNVRAFKCLEECEKIEKNIIDAALSAAVEGNAVEMIDYLTSSDRAIKQASIDQALLHAVEAKSAQAITLLHKKFLPPESKSIGRAHLALAEQGKLLQLFALAPDQERKLEVQEANALFRHVLKSYDSQLMQGLLTRNYLPDQAQAKTALQAAISAADNTVVHKLLGSMKWGIPQLEQALASLASKIVGYREAKLGPKDVVEKEQSEKIFALIAQKKEHLEHLSREQKSKEPSAACSRDEEKVCSDGDPTATERVYEILPEDPATESIWGGDEKICAPSDAAAERKTNHVASLFRERERSKQWLTGANNAVCTVLPPYLTDIVSEYSAPSLITPEECGVGRSKPA